LENIKTFPEMNIITDMNKSPWGSVINEREI